MTSVVDCAIVGAGPAGLTAAHYLRRFHRSVALFDDGDSRARRIVLSRNVPGFPEGIAGGDLLALMSRQAREVGVEPIAERVLQIERRGEGFRVRTGARQLRARSILLATGTHDVEPDIAGVDVVRARGRLRQCPVCDGYEATDRRIVVIGRGVHGVREATFLQTFSDDVVLVDLDGPARVPPCDGALRVATAPPRRLDLVHDDIVVTLADSSRHTCDVVYAALGSVPKSDPAEWLGAKTDRRGNVIVDAHCRTSVAGVFAAGDVVAGLDQIAVAMGHAAIAATTVHNELRDKDALPVRAASVARRRASLPAPRGHL